MGRTGVAGPMRSGTIDPRAHRQVLRDQPAGLCPLRLSPQIRIEKRQPRRAAQKASDTAIEVDEVAHPIRPSEPPDTPEILQVQEPHAKAAVFLVRDHHVGFLEVPGVKAGIMKASDLARDRIENAPAPARIAPLDFPWPESEPAQRVAIEQ